MQSLPHDEEIGELVADFKFTKQQREELRQAFGGTLDYKTWKKITSDGFIDLVEMDVELWLSAALNQRTNNSAVKDRHGSIIKTCNALISQLTAMEFDTRQPYDMLLQYHSKKSTVSRESRISEIEDIKAASLSMKGGLGRSLKKPDERFLAVLIAKTYHKYFQKKPAINNTGSTNFCEFMSRLSSILNIITGRDNIIIGRDVLDYAVNNYTNECF
jgi:hypothetical protein